MKRRSLLVGGLSLLAKPALAGMPYLAIPRDPFAYPVGIAPGFDQRHPASLGCVVSAITEITGTMINLVNGAKAGVSGSPTLSIDTIGPAVTVNASQASTGAQQFTITTPAGAFTGAVIFRANTITAALRNGLGVNNNQALVITNLSGFVAVRSANVTQVTSPAVTLTAGVPYFIACSASAARDCIVIVNLATGATIAQNLSGNASSVETAITLQIGNNGASTGSLNGPISCAMYSSNALSLPQLQAWAADPYAFWFPRIALDDESGI